MKIKMFFMKKESVNQMYPYFILFVVEEASMGWIVF